MKDVDVFYSNHKEADIRMVQHASSMSKGNVEDQNSLR